MNDKQLIELYKDLPDEYYGDLQKQFKIIK